MEKSKAWHLRVVSGEPRSLPCTADVSGKLFLVRLEWESLTVLCAWNAGSGGRDGQRGPEAPGPPALVPALLSSEAALPQPLHLFVYTLLLKPVLIVWQLPPAYLAPQHSSHCSSSHWLLSLAPPVLSCLTIGLRFSAALGIIPRARSPHRGLRAICGWTHDASCKSELIFS